jgi:7-cyano-7-deazaguanine tRNA-ribosyltransferase
VFSCNNWDGLAKLGSYEVNEKQMKTPALFPVVDPIQQDIPTATLQKEFSFDQVITSAYLMSKRNNSSTNWSEYPSVHQYLDFDGIVMMDSGAYQVLLYGDINLGVKDTIQLQSAVKPDIGVIMDHPIGYNNTFREAQKRNQTTIDNIHTSLELFGNQSTKWTLPIQGGKYIDLLSAYIDEILKNQIIDRFDMFALGSVVPVMINQDYTTLVKMIATARAKLPITYPLHLFGAGHPAMFALAVFLGCDTFDSAAYALMAKDDRYMTVEGTYQFDHLDDFPCTCKICVSITPRELRDLSRDDRRPLLTKHNLYVSSEEIRKIRNAIKIERLWDLVQQRAGSVPKLAKATRLAIEYVTTGKLKQLCEAGTPVSSSNAIRVARPIDVKKPALQRITALCDGILDELVVKNLYLIAYSMEESIYNKLDPKLLETAYTEDITYCLLLPPFGIVPFGIRELYPVGQLVHDLDITDFDHQRVTRQISRLKEKGLSSITLIVPDSWPKKIIENLQDAFPDLTSIYTDKPMAFLQHNPMDKSDDLISTNESRGL